VQLFLTFTSGFEFFGGDTLLLRIKVRLFDLEGQLLDIKVSNTLLEPTLYIIIYNLREGAELFLDGLRFLDKYLKHPVLDTLGQDEVVTADLGSWLELAVDAAVALLDATRIPR